MAEKMTSKEWADKAKWEGGIVDVFEYGLSADDLDEGVDPEFRSAVDAAHKAWSLATEPIHTLEEMIEDLEDDDDES